MQNYVIQYTGREVFWKGNKIMKKYALILSFCVILAGCLVILTGCSLNTKEEIMTDKKVLVAYFSATGTTEKVAEKLAKTTGADLFKIVPAQPYTADDLNWQNPKSRSSVEMNDKSSRPAISSKVENMQAYNVVFVGFPVWWYREPSIIDTFMESYDFSGKIIIPFATSGGSPIGNSGKNMQALVPEAKVFAGKCFPVTVEEDELQKWAEEWL